MVTKKKSSKKSSKKASKKSSSGKSSKSAGAASKSIPGNCKWKAWQDSMPPGPSTIHVVGSCRFPRHGFKVKLTKAVPQGINPAILLLKKTVTSGPGIMIPEVVEVHFKAKALHKYTHVTIIPDGVTIKVLQVS